MSSKCEVRTSCQVSVILYQYYYSIITIHSFYLNIFSLHILSKKLIFFLWHTWSTFGWYWFYWQYYYHMRTANIDMTCRRQNKCSNHQSNSQSNDLITFLHIKSVNSRQHTGHTKDRITLLLAGLLLGRELYSQYSRRKHFVHISVRIIINKQKWKTKTCRSLVIYKLFPLSANISQSDLRIIKKPNCIENSI